MLPLVIQIERTEEHVADTCAFARSPVRIGRNALSDLQLDESFVSQWHGVIRFDEERTSYVDLGSTNPTLVDGQPIRRNVEVVVTDTTDIRIGSLRLHLLRVPAPPELFGARRKSSFARASGPPLAANSVQATVYLGGAAAASISKLPGRSSHPPHAVGVPVSTRPNSASSSQLRAAVASNANLGMAATRLAAPAAASGSAVRPASVPAPIASADLVGLQRDYQNSRELFLGAVRSQLEQAQGPDREQVFERLIRDFPELGNEPPFRRLLAQLGISAWRSGVPEIGDWLSRLTDGLYPPPGQAAQVNQALTMERIGELLEVFSSAFIELRVAHEQFCEEMALEEPPQESLLNTSKNPRAILAFLLNPAADGGSRATDLARAMADFAVHQVALVSAVVEGARDVLQELSPNLLSGRDKPGASFFGKLLGNDQRELWSRYVKTFDEMVDADRFTRKLFGSGFARKYYAITGGRRSLPETSPRARDEARKP